MAEHTILVVDDQMINRKILVKLLSPDYDILEAVNGEEALRVLRENRDRVSAVLLDIVMPVLDGYGVLKAMREDPKLAGIPVLVSSQQDGDEAELKALTMGANDFVSKPYKADIIRHRLENTIRLRESAAIANKAKRDELTGLMSKQFFVEKVEEYLKKHRDEKFKMLCFDIERFKLVNDTFGEKIGNELLCWVANLLRKTPGAVYTSRFTADHFYQLFPEHESSSEKTYRHFFEDVRKFPVDMNINISSGVYLIDDVDAPVISMCDRAKLAAEINRDHANELFSYYDDSVRKKQLNEQFILGAMQEGIDRHQFQVYYQPKYDLHTEMIAGAEALVRWNHPERGFMSPGEFIPVFERNGFITRLDRYVWEETCKSIRSWMDRGLPPVPVSVNVSRADIFNPNLVEILLGLVERYQIPISYLHLEITESAYTNDPAQIIQTVGRLHDLGFTMEMDDFGSGYSSLNMLAEMPVDVLKLDMGFVQTETRNTSGRGIMSFVISLAKWMKLSVIAEGVETAEQISALRSMDCQFVQGYYFAKPMPLEKFEALLHTVAVSAIKDNAEHPNGAKNKRAPKNDRVMLIVDDIEVNRAVLNSIFCNEYRVVEKENGWEALEYLRANVGEVEVVLLDLLMPVMDGFRLIERIRGDENLRELPIIVTSQGDVSAEERALDLGADDFVAKPYSPQIVGHRVHTIIENHRSQKEKQQELEESRKREQTLMSTIPGGVAIYHFKKDGQFRTEYASDGIVRMCGYEPPEYQQWLQADGWVKMVPEDLPRIVAATEEAIQTGRPIHEVQHMYTKDGSTITVRMDASVITNGNMEPDDRAVLYTVHTKVSDEAEALLQEQSRYRYILDNLDVAYFELDADGTFYASDKYSLYALSEVRIQEVMRNTGASESVHPADLPILFHFLDLKQKGLPKISVTLRLKMKDGSYRWTEMIAFYDYDEHEAISKTFMVLRDMDSEWQNQNRKLQSALSVAEKANQAKTDFLARISHEMRTPLNGILGLAELMSDRQNDKERSRDVEELKQSGRYLLNLIDDTLDVSSIEKGQMQLNPVVCDGKMAFQNVVGMVKSGMDRKKINFHMETKNLPFTMLYIDVGRVEQAVMNVLSNAMKFTPEGGTVELLMENIAREGNIITDRITVTDTGVGIGEEFLPHIFEPFAQEHGDTTSRYSGTGLGMTIAKQCVELMGGTISVESKVGVGTKVTIVLPLRAATAEQLNNWHNEQDKEDLLALRGKRILLCEDHPLNARIAIRLLEKKGIRVDHAANGQIGVQRFAQSPEGCYAAVLMDVRMPVMDGLEATQAIRRLKRKDARQVPIIAMTANALQDDVRRSLNAGMTEHLGKPVEPEKLYRTLAKLIVRPNPFVGRKILVVDDIEMNRSMVKRAILDWYTVLEAANGEEALEQMKKNPDLIAVVTDVQMPRMDGKELIRRIRADRTFDHVAILANTVYGDHRQEEELLALGANDFVYKPTSPMVVQMRLEHILRNMEYHF